MLLNFMHVCYSTKIAKHAESNIKIEEKQEVIAPQIHTHKVAWRTKFIKNISCRLIN